MQRRRVAAAIMMGALTGGSEPAFPARGPVAAFLGQVAGVEGDAARGWLVRMRLLRAIDGVRGHSEAVDLICPGPCAPLAFVQGEIWLVRGRLGHVGVETDARAGSRRLTDAGGNPDCTAWRQVIDLIGDPAVLPQRCR